MSQGIEDRLVEGEELDELRDLMQSGFDCLCHLVEEPADPDSNSVMIAALRSAVEAFRSGKHPGDDFADPETAAYAMGTLWGDVVCDAIQWQWVHLKFTGDEPDGYAVASPDRAWVTFPHLAFYAMLNDKSTDNSVARTFNSIVAGELPASKPGGYVIVG